MDKKSSKKLVWYILFAIITVVMCYLLVVVYFHIVSPNNITTKLAIWPFNSTQKIGEMYLDAVVEIDFTIEDDETLESEEKKVVGVNIRQDGYIIAPYNEFVDCDETTEYKILTNAGGVYNGAYLYGDKHYNVCVLKVENIASDQKIKIPFVSITSVSQGLFSNKQILAISSPIQTKNVWTGTIVDFELSNIYRETTRDGKNVVDFVLEDCYSVGLKDGSFTGGAIFDKKGGFLGLSYEDTLEDGSYIIMPVGGVKNFLEKVIDSYEKNQKYDNKLIKSFIGFDQIELSCFKDAAETNENQTDKECFYFNGEFQIFTDELITYLNSDITGYYLFEALIHNDKTIIDANKVIYAISHNSKTYLIDTKIELFDLLYDVESGDNLTLFFYDVDKLGIERQSASFMV
ncbi:MAG: hypothetical protein E7375_01185 [Clostridiales bacterium]|nr:hypothetical protein [Clostridiales bacterium]